MPATRRHSAVAAAATAESSVVQVTDRISTDSIGVRGFLRYGFPWILDAVPYEYLPDEEREKFVFELARLALTTSDAFRQTDKAGIREAAEAIIDRVKQREADLLLEQKAKAT